MYIIHINNITSYKIENTLWFILENSTIYFTEFHTQVKQLFLDITIMLIQLQMNKKHTTFEIFMMKSPMTQE